MLRQLCRIDQKGEQDLVKDGERGSATIEAAVTLPLFVCLCVILMWLFLTARAEAALQDAVQEAVKTTAAHAYPADLLLNAFQQHTFVQQWEHRIDEFVPETIRMMLKEQLIKNTVPPDADTKLNGWSNHPSHDEWAGPFVMQFVDRNSNGDPVLERNRLTVRSVLLPTFSSEETSYFGIVAEYQMPVPIPFFREDIVLRASAVERTWVGEK